MTNRSGAGDAGEPKHWQRPSVCGLFSVALGEQKKATIRTETAAAADDVAESKKHDSLITLALMPD
ncbi:MAG: hypothetical protein LAT68_06070 [Cyclobacteriaceae bacterium]|nr:hypothetical protein [Cyclobacteriaceae bacterium]MCH8515877.1 hypothetical protein [Cyclobacteriaceae bacterium]